MSSLIKLPTFNDSRGSLSVVEKILPFEIKRVYYIYHVNPEVDRGGHRHKKNQQALICVCGSCIISCDNGEFKTDYILDSPDKCLILEPRDFHIMHHFTKDAILLVLASEYFYADDYIDGAYS